MPSFDIQVTGASFVPWVDPPGTSAPSRLNDNKIHVAGRWQVQSPGSLVVSAVVLGEVGPPDGDAVLGGNAFCAVLSEFSGLPPPQVTQASGHLSIVTIAFLPIHAGHHVLLLTLGGAADPLTPGGGLLIPIDVV